MRRETGAVPQVSLLQKCHARLILGNGLRLQLGRCFKRGARRRWRVDPIPAWCPALFLRIVCSCRDVEIHTHFGPAASRHLKNLRSTIPRLKPQAVGAT